MFKFLRRHLQPVPDTTFKRFPPLTREELKIRTRLQHILGWHTRVDDAALSDIEFIRAVMARFSRHQGIPLIDPNE